MKTIKLADWCEKTGVKYLTAWRWFRDDKMPVYAYKTKSGTILVEDDDEEEKLENPIDSCISLFLKKVIEFSNNKSTVEQFASYVLSNFKLSPITIEEKTKYSKNKPDQKDVQKYFKKFLPNKPFELNCDVDNKIYDEINYGEINEDNVKKIQEELSACFSKPIDLNNDLKTLKEINQLPQDKSFINLYEAIVNEGPEDIEEINSNDIDGDGGELSLNDLKILVNNIISCAAQKDQNISPPFHRVADEPVSANTVNEPSSCVRTNKK